MKKAILLGLLLPILASCSSLSHKPAKKMYIITVLKKEYNPITGTMDPVADVDTAYETNDLDAYFDGVNSYHSVIEAVAMLTKSGNKAAALLQKPVSFSVVNNEGVDLSVLLSQKQMDSIKRILFHN